MPPPSPSLPPPPRPSPKATSCRAPPHTGKTRHDDWLLHLGDHMCYESRRVGEHSQFAYAEGETAWLLPDLHGDNAGTKLSGYIKGLQEGPAGLQRYASVAIKLPPDPTAAGIRHGAADSLARFIQAELAVHNTGHDLTGLCALWEYLRARIALCMPGAIVLAGWPPLPYGQMGDGPKHPLLAVLVGTSLEVGVLITLERLDKMIDHLFNLCDQSLPKLRIDGELRPMLHATLATMIMYYQERFAAEPQEAPKIGAYMRQAFKAVFNVTLDVTLDYAHSKLIEWGHTMRRQFDLDNLHLDAKLAHGDSEQVIHCIKQVGSSVANSHVLLSDVAARQVNIEAHQNKIDTKLDAILSLLTKLAPPSAMQASGASAACADASSSPVLASGASAAASSSVPAGASAAASSASITAATHAAAAAAASAAASSRAAVGACAGLVRSSDRPVVVHLLDDGPYSTASPLTSGRFFLDCMTLGQRLPKALINDDRRKSDALKVLHAYLAMADESEKQILKQDEMVRDQRQANTIVNQLTDLLVKRIRESYREHQQTPPARFGKDTILFNTMVDNIRRSRLDVGSSTRFTVWRRRLSSAGASSSSLPAGGASSPAPHVDVDAEASSRGEVMADMLGSAQSSSPLGKRVRQGPAPVYAGDDDESDDEEAFDAAVPFQTSSEGPIDVDDSEAEGEDEDEDEEGEDDEDADSGSESDEYLRQYKRDGEARREKMAANAAQSSSDDSD